MVLCTSSKTEFLVLAQVAIRSRYGLQTTIDYQNRRSYILELKIDDSELPVKFRNAISQELKTFAQGAMYVAMTN